MQGVPVYICYSQAVLTRQVPGNNIRIYILFIDNDMGSKPGG